MGREQLLASLAAARPGNRAQIADTNAIVGGGKTKLLERLRKLAAQPSALVLKVELAESDAAEPAKSPVRAFARFKEIVEDLVIQSIQTELDHGGSGKSAEHAFDPVSKAVQTTKNTTSLLNVNLKVDARSATITSSSVGTVTVDQGSMTQALLAAQQDVANTFTRVFPEVLRNRTAVLTIDGFEWVAASLLGDWLLDLVRRLATTLTVVARTPDVSIVAQPDADMPVYALQPLTTDEIRQLLELSLPDQAVDQALVDVVAEFSSGHPQTAGLAAELLQRLNATERQAATFESRIASLPTDLAKKQSDLVDAIIERDPPDLAEAVGACAIVRRFDSGLLEALLPDQSGKGGALIEQLQRYTFIEPVADPRRGFFRMHEYIRDELDRRVEQVNPARYAKLNGAAADYISTWLNDFEESHFEQSDFESVQRQYRGWYRYERDDWQAAVREWLYHQARSATGPSADKERQQGRLRFARIVLDAFWWWGLYLKFPFIDQLLEDWRDSQADLKWADDLETLVVKYPPGYDKDSDPKRWDAVFQALQSVKVACGLAGPLQPLQEQERHVRGLIDLFMAHSRRYRAPDDSQAADQLYAAARKYYDEAIEIFRGLDDDWDLAWTYFESSELELKRGGERARENWKAAVELLPGQGDDELCANIYRVAADASWPNNPLKAFTDHGSAIWHAYLFQGRYQGVRYRPDAYTLMFYEEQLERATSRLIEHASNGGDPVSDLAQLRIPLVPGGNVDPTRLKAWCAGADRDSIAALFPAPPPHDQLEIMPPDSPFLKQWEATIEQVGEGDAVCPESAW